MSDERLYRIALNSVPYMEPSIYHRIVAAFGSAEEAFRSDVGSLKQVDGVFESSAQKIKDTDPIKTAEREIKLSEKLGAKITLMGEEGYPAPLMTIYSPPPVLSIAGEWKPEDAAAIAVVGTRTPTQYGKHLTEKLVTGLVESGIAIISGLARGVDGIAHRVAIGAKGRTIAALGSGLNVYYPPEHKELQKKIPEHGAVVSQFPFTAQPDKMTFPMRNRVVSGLSLGVLVIEAGDKSGALITAYAALSDNRDVFALPGPVNSRMSAGTNKLIKKGHAKLVESADDILDELPQYIKNTFIKKQLTLAGLDDEPMSEDEGRVMGVLDHEARHIDTVSGMSGLPSSIVSAILLSLELKGKVRQIPGKLFVRN